MQRRLRGGEGSVDATTRVLRQRDCTLQERSRSGETAPRLRAPRRELQRYGSLLVVAGRGGCQVPGAAVGVRLAIGGVGERAMHTMSVAGRGRAVCGRTDEWMGEFDAATDVEEPGLCCRFRCGDVDTEALRRTVKEQWVADGVRGRGEYEQPAVG